VLALGRTKRGTPTSALLIPPEARTQPASISVRDATAPQIPEISGGFVMEAKTEISG